MSAVLKAKERWIKVVSVEFSASKSDAPLITKKQLIKALQGLQGLISRNEAVYHTDSGNIQTSLDQLLWRNEEKTRLCLLVSQGNSSRSDPSFRNRSTGDKREVKRMENEDPAFSCHLVIDINESQCGNIICYGYLEEIGGITPSHLTSFLKFLFRKSDVKFHYIRPDHSNSNFFIKIDIRIFAPKKLEEQYDETDIEHIAFERAEPVAELDEDNYTAKGRGKLEFKVEYKPKTFDSLWEWLNKFRAKVEQVRGPYDKMKVKYRSDERSGSFDVNKSKKNEVMEAFLTKYCRLTLDNEVKQCQEYIHKELVEKMNKELDVILKNKQ